jgi:hypothetical protein
VAAVWRDVCSVPLVTLAPSRCLRNHSVSRCGLIGPPSSSEVGALFSHDTLEKRRWYRKLVAEGVVEHREAR